MPKTRNPEEGVSTYTVGFATIPVSFPLGYERCQYCDYCRNEDSLKRYLCRLTGEYILKPFTGRGARCPVVFDEKEDN